MKNTEYYCECIRCCHFVAILDATGDNKVRPFTSRLILLSKYNRHRVTSQISVNPASESGRSVTRTANMTISSGSLIWWGCWLRGGQWPGAVASLHTLLRALGAGRALSHLGLLTAVMLAISGRGWPFIAGLYMSIIRRGRSSRRI